VSEENAATDLENAIRRSLEAFNRRDFDAAFAVFAPDVWDASPIGWVVFGGRELLRAF